MNLGAFVRRVIGTRPVTVDGLLTRDDVIKLLDDWDSRHDLIIITRNGTKDLKWLLAGPCKSDDLRAAKMLFDTLGDIL